MCRGQKGMLLVAFPERRETANVRAVPESFRDVFRRRHLGLVVKVVLLLRNNSPPTHDHFDSERLGETEATVSLSRTVNK